MELHKFFSEYYPGYLSEDEKTHKILAFTPSQNFTNYYARLLLILNLKPTYLDVLTK